MRRSPRPPRPRRSPSAKVATSVARAAWAGTSRRIARVTMPRVPSLPTKSLSSDSPATSLIRLPPRRDQRAVGEHDVQAEDVVGGDAVLHAAQPARVGGDVAADRADLERRRVGRVPQAVLGGGRLHLGVEGARLDHRDPAGDVDLDGPHPLQADHDARRRRPTSRRTGRCRRRAARRAPGARRPSAPRSAPGRRPPRARPRAVCRRRGRALQSWRYRSQTSSSVCTTPDGSASTSWRRASGVMGTTQARPRCTEPVRFGPCPLTSRPPASTPSATTPSATTTPSAWPRRSGPAGSRARRRSRPRSPAPACWTSQLSGLAADRFSEATEEAAAAHDGFFAGQPSFVKDNSDVEGLPTQQGTRAYVAQPARRDGSFARMYGLIGTTTLGKTRLSEYGFSASAEFVDDAPGPQPVAHRPHLGSVLGGVRRLRRRRRGADGARERRRRLDPDPGRVQRAGRAQGHPRPDPQRQGPPGDAGEDRARRCPQPVRARHRGVRPRVRARLPQPQAASGRRRDRTRARSGCGSRWSPTRSAAG